jgi:hypothetical protein
LGLGFEIVVSEHIAHFLEVVWRLQPYKVILLTSSSVVTAVIFIYEGSTSLAYRCIKVAPSTTFLAEV